VLLNIIGVFFLKQYSINQKQKIGAKEKNSFISSIIEKSEEE